MMKMLASANDNERTRAAEAISRFLDAAEISFVEIGQLLAEPVTDFSRVRRLRSEVCRLEQTARKRKAKIDQLKKEIEERDRRIEELTAVATRTLAGPAVTAEPVTFDAIMASIKELPINDFDQFKCRFREFCGGGAL